MFLVIIDLVYNLALLVALSVVSGFVGERWRTGTRGLFLQGVVFGSASVIGMLRPLVLTPGLIFDGRSVMISLCALFFGPLAGGVAGSMAALCRIYLGGSGTIMGLAVIASSAVLGTIIHARRSRQSRGITVSELLVFGCLVQGAMLAMAILLPAGTRLDTLTRIGLPVMLTYPLATVLIGKILSDQQARRRYVEALWESREEFRTTLYSIGDAVITTDRDGRVRHLNPVAEQLLGYGEAEASGEPLEAVFRIIHEETRKTVENPVKRVLSDGKVVGLANHTLLIARDGIERPIADSGAPIRDERGHVTGVVLVFRDQTAERAQEAILRENEVIFNSFMANSPIYVFFKDSQIRSIRLSANFTSMLGRPMKDLLGKPMDELFPADLARSIVADDERVLREGKQVTVNEELNGRYYTTIKFPIHIDGKPPYLAGFTIDTTERTLAESALTRRIDYEQAAAKCMRLLVDMTDVHARLQDVVELLLEAVGASRAYIFRNDEAAQLGLCTSQSHEAVADGITPELENPLLQKTTYKHAAPAMLSLLEARQAFKGIVRELAEPERSLLQQQQIQSVLILPIFSGQHLWGFLGFDDCVTERHWAEDDIRLLQVVADGIGAAALRVAAEEDREHLESQLRQSQKMEAIGRLAGGVAHDFNNMLNVILGHAELAKDELTPTHPLHEHVDEISKAAMRSADLTRQLLAFARKQTIAPRTLDLNTTVESLLKMLGRLIGENVELLWQPCDGLWNVRFDPAQADHVLVNLVVNSRDALAGAGTIIIETQNVEFDELWCAANPDYEPGTFAMLAVRDDGCGMSADALQKLFEPFYTTKEVGKGTGLGLATVYGIMKQHRGFVRVESEIGVGTCVQLYLPRDEEAPTTQEVHRGIPRALTGTETILLLEDEPALLNLGTRFLSRLGYHVLAAGTPAQAIHFVENQETTVELLVTDVVMPDMNGREVWQRLQTHIPGLKCLYISGYTADEITDSGFIEANVHFLPKPFNVQTLAAKVREALDS